MEDRVVVIGIDEAGYGPVLGPLVISAAAFSLPAELVDQSLWKVLRESISADRDPRGARIPVMDSKLLYKRPEGVGRLERSVLSMLSAWRGTPPNLDGLIQLLCPQVIEQLAEYPWYELNDCRLPIAADAGGIRIASTRLKRTLESRDVRIEAFGSAILPEGHFNKMVTTTDNKAIVLFSLTMQLIFRIASMCKDCGRDVRIVIDKQGGRDFYGPALLRSFGERKLRVMEESSLHSAYELAGDGDSWRVSFTQGGETEHLPIALASLFSKYLREALMACFNRYWSRHVPDIRPTAGYYGDGQRFVRAIMPHAIRLGIARENLIRAR